jgi:ribosomal protein L40E
MPCYRCGARQTDPAAGPSPWKRGVRDRAQVLVCPRCQAGRDWTADLDACPRCGSTALVRTLGETSCRGCGASPVTPVPVGERVGAGAAGAAVPAASVEVPPERAALAAEVAAAIDRVLARSPRGDA